MDAAVATMEKRDDRSALILLAGLLTSMALHGGVLGWASLRSLERMAALPVEMEIVQVEPPKPPPPPPEPEKPEPPKPKPPPVKVAVIKPPPDEPPPPIEEAPPEPPKPVPLFVGISMSSTTAAGSFAAPVGNTAYGKVGKAANPDEVKPYYAPKYVPPGAADRDPEVSYEFKPPYPDEARRANIEGLVMLRIVVDDQGRVVDAKILKGPGYGLDEAALAAIKKFKFKPAIKDGEAVSTTLSYNYRFELD